MLKLSNLALLFFLTSVAFGQEMNHFSKKYSEDSEMEVINLTNGADEEDQVALFIEDEFVGNQTMYSSLNPDKIENLEVDKELFRLHNIQFDGKIILSYKEEYQPEYVSIKDLILEQTDIKNPVVVQIDEEVLDLDYAICKLDKNYILKLILKEIPTSQKGQNILLAKFITKTPANIAEANTITIK